MTLDIISYSNGPELKDCQDLLDNNVSEWCRKNFTSIEDTEYTRHDSLFESYNSLKYSKLDGFFKEYDRVTIRINDNWISNNINCEWYDVIRRTLSNNGYQILDYISGICTKEDRKYKIGKILSRLDVSEKLINGFANSVVRNSSKKKYVITISRNPYDIATMSTFKGWSSCMNLISGGYSNYVRYDLMCGTIIVYIHEEDDIEIKNPASRSLLKPLTKDGFVMYMPELGYGTSNCDAELFGNEICEEINSTVDKPEDDICIFVLDKHLYDDGIKDKIYYYKEGFEWDFYNKKHIDIFNSYLHNLKEEDLKDMLKDHKNKELLISNYHFDDYVEYNFTEELLEKIRLTDLSITHIYERFSYKLSVFDVINFYPYVEQTIFERCIFNSNINNIEEAKDVLPKECIKIYKLYKSKTDTLTVMSKDELKYMNNLNLIIDLPIDLALSIAYCEIVENLNPSRIIHNLNFNQLMVLYNNVDIDTLVDYIKNVRMRFYMNKNLIKFLYMLSWNEEIYSIIHKKAIYKDFIRSIPYVELG